MLSVKIGDTIAQAGASEFKVSSIEILNDMVHISDDKRMNVITVPICPGFSEVIDVMKNVKHT
jgi:hypothetical protein